LYYFPIEALRTTGITEQEKILINKCDIFIMQRGHMQFPSFIDDLPSDCRIISFPVIWFNTLWPFYRVDARNKNTKDAEFPFGKYPYGDKEVISLLKKGLTTEEVFRKYMDLNVLDKIDLNNFHADNLSMGKELENKCDLKIYDYIGKNFLNKRLFYTFNHPAPELLLVQLEQILGKITGEKISNSQKQKIFKMNPLGNMELPIHPQIIEHFNLEWISTDYKYKYGQKTFITFEKYCWNYINCE